MTVAAARKLQNIFRFVAKDVRGSAEVIFSAAANTGDCSLAQWFCNEFGMAGLTGVSHTYDTSRLAINVMELVCIGCRLSHVKFVAWMIEHFDLRLDEPGIWSQLFHAAAESGSVPMMKSVYSNRPKIVETRRFLNRARVTELHNAQEHVMFNLCRTNNIVAIQWALAAFDYSQERINETTASCMLFKCGANVIRFLLRTPLGRGPEAERVRRYYDMLTDESHARVGELPDEPEDSVFDPESALDVVRLPPPESEEPGGLVLDPEFALDVVPIPQLDSSEED